MIVCFCGSFVEIKVRRVKISNLIAKGVTCLIALNTTLWAR